MSLALADRWVWDFWLVHHAGRHHIFYLQAPRDLPDPEDRHWNVSIGHAESTDLRSWQALPDALAPAQTPAWDDFTTWTGSIIAHDRRWWMFYTGSSHADEGLVQRIGAATSADLVNWERVGDAPLVELDPRFYEQLDTDLWHDQAWRDPWLIREGEQFHMFCTARAPTGDPATRGVIAHAVSKNLLDWTVLPPVTEPGAFGEMEVPQVVKVGTDWCLVFCAPPSPGSATLRVQGASVRGTHLLRAKRMCGPFRWSEHSVLDADLEGTRYGGKLVRTQGRWAVMSWLGYDSTGHFLGEIADPVAVALGDEPAVSGDLPSE